MLNNARGLGLVNDFRYGGDVPKQNLEYIRISYRCFMVKCDCSYIRKVGELPIMFPPLKAANGDVLLKKMFLKISQISQENI